MTSPPSLPNEIQEIIFDQLALLTEPNLFDRSLVPAFNQVSRRNRSLKPILLVCRSWISTAQRVLYRRVAPSTVSSCLALIETLRSNPDLASYIKQVDLIDSSEDRVLAQCQVQLVLLCREVTILQMAQIHQHVFIQELVPAMQSSKLKKLIHLDQYFNPINSIAQLMKVWGETLQDLDVFPSPYEEDHLDLPESKRERDFFEGTNKKLALRTLKLSCSFGYSKIDHFTESLCRNAPNLTTVILDEVGFLDLCSVFTLFIPARDTLLSFTFREEDRPSGGEELEDPQRFVTELKCFRNLRLLDLNFLGLIGFPSAFADYIFETLEMVSLAGVLGEMFWRRLGKLITHPFQHGPTRLRLLRFEIGVADEEMILTHIEDEEAWRDYKDYMKQAFEDAKASGRFQFLEDWGKQPLEIDGTRNGCRHEYVW